MVVLYSLVGVKFPFFCVMYSSVGACIHYVCCIIVFVQVRISFEIIKLNPQVAFQFEHKVKLITDLRGMKDLVQIIVYPCQ